MQTLLISKKMQDNKKMQPAISHPVAKRTRKQTTNLGKPSDQLKIHRATYHTHLIQTLQLPTGQTEKLLKLYDQLIDAEQMATLFSLPIIIFHAAFIQKLQSL